jgi:hypothetical protein
MLKRPPLTLLKKGRQAEEIPQFALVHPHYTLGQRTHRSGNTPAPCIRLPLNFEIKQTGKQSIWIMSDYAFFEYRAKLLNPPSIEEKDRLAHGRRGIIWVQAMRGERICCVIRMIDFQDERLRAHIELEQEAQDIVLFALNPGSRSRISHSTICEVDEGRLRELGPPPDFHIIGSTEIYFYSS